ncbi:MAG: ATP-binding protein [Defluviitaleaceae bacterium]|nr:ATP-binding protein [Defluviitaleaceae bacterium]MCL2264016.1 ATP-binding protein [Defluviitaleaceae bacterium]
MLKKFEFKNSYSYLDKVSFDMSAELSSDAVDKNGNPAPKDVELYEVVRKRVSGCKYGILPVAAIYGKNAGGKTNLLKSLGDAAKDALGVSFTEATGSSPFAQLIENRQFIILDVGERKSVSWYHICVVLGEDEYALEYSIGSNGVVDEKVIKRSTKRDAIPEIMYDRNNPTEGTDPIINKYIDLMKTRVEKQLWFPLIAPAHDKLNIFFEWFRCVRDGLTFNDTEANNQIIEFEKIAQRIADEKDEPFRKRLLFFLQCLDVSVSGIAGEKGQSGKHSLRVYHNNANENMPEYKDSWAHYIGKESSGTRKLIEQFPQIYKALEDGTPFVCDELDRMLHPVVFKQLVKVFNCPKENDKNAQLIFTAHDTIALDSDIMRRDEVHIIDKGKYSISEIKRLSEMPEVHAYPNMELDFRTGIYGSFPTNFNNAYKREV